MEPTARSLARTYSDRVYPDPWEKVEDYQRVCRRTPLNTQTRGGRPWGTRSNCRPPASVAGSTAANPIRCAGFRRRARTAGSNPTAIWPVRWLSCSRTSSRVEASTRRLSGNLDRAAGRPRDDRGGVRGGRRRNQSRHADSDGRATELYPTTDASVLGRCLVAMGAPARRKTGLDAVPAVVWEKPRIDPTAVRRDIRRAPRSSL